MMQIEEGYRMNAEADTVLPVADPDCVSLENSVLHILTFKPDLSCRNWNKVSCIAYCIGTIERRSVTSRYHGSTISGRQQNERRRRRQGERQKNIFILTNNFARALPSLHHYNMKLRYFTSPLYGVGEHNKKIVASFF